MRDGKENVAQLRWIQGQAEEIRRMLGEGRPCEEVILQIMSCRAALEEVAFNVVTDYLEECMMKTPSSEATRATIDRALTLFLRMSPATPSSTGH